MGLFSFITSDTKESIPSRYSDRDTFAVRMLDDKGNEWHESNYEGYGRFGGKDIYELIAEMNGAGSDRSAGCALSHSKDENVRNALKLPKLVRADCKTPYYLLDNITSCPDQGFLYD